MRIKFTKKGFEKVASEIRKAAWAAWAFFTGGGFFAHSYRVYVMGAVFWLIFQIYAFVIDAIDVDG